MDSSSSSDIAACVFQGLHVIVGISQFAMIFAQEKKQLSTFQRPYVHVRRFDSLLPFDDAK